MGQTRVKTELEELRREGWNALVERLGVDGAIELLQRLVPPSGDYTAERHAWLDQVSLEELLEEHRTAKAETLEPE